jgi:hypothetical protein
MCVLALFIASFASRSEWGKRMFPAKIYVGQIAVVFGLVVASTWSATQ